MTHSHNVCFMTRYSLCIANSGGFSIDNEGQVMSGALPSRQVVAIHLPASLINDRRSVGIFFALCDTHIIFSVGCQEETNTTFSIINSVVLGATVGLGINFDNLAEPVAVVFRLKPLEDSVSLTMNCVYETFLTCVQQFIIRAPDSEMCVTLDFDLNDWIPRG